MTLERTLHNLRQTKESFFNLEDKSMLTHDLLKKDLLFNATWNTLLSPKFFNTKHSTNYKTLKSFKNIYDEYFLVKISF